jgi:hypothetical protein
MATLDGLRRKIKTSIHGRRLGLDDTGHLAGAKGFRMPITSATSDTTGTEIGNFGLASVVTTTNDTWILEDPVEGCQVTLAAGSSSTGVHTIDVSPAVIYSTNGLEGDQVLLKSRGAYCTLTGLTTAVWLMTARGSTASVSISS